MGIAIVLPVPPSVASRLVVPQHAVNKAVKQSSMHLTLAYLEGPFTQTDTKLLLNRAKAFFSQIEPFESRLTGVGRFTVVYGDDPFFVTVNPNHQLVGLRFNLCEMLRLNQFKHDETHGFYPHITIAYVDKLADSPKRRLAASMTIEFDSAVVTNSWDETVTPIPFRSDTTT